MADSTKASARPVKESEPITAIDKLVLINTPQATVLAVESNQFDRSVFVRELSNIYDQIGRGNPASIERIVKNPKQEEARAWLAAAKSAIEEDLQKKDVTAGSSSIGTQLHIDMLNLYRYSNAYFTRVREATPKINNSLASVEAVAALVGQISAASADNVTVTNIIAKLNTAIGLLREVKNGVRFQQDSAEEAKDIATRYELSDDSL